MESNIYLEPLVLILNLQPILVHLSYDMLKSRVFCLTHGWGYWVMFQRSEDDDGEIWMTMRWKIWEFGGRLRFMVGGIYTPLKDHLTVVLQLSTEVCFVSMGRNSFGNHKLIRERKQIENP
jgi:hypothetical protein